MTRNDRTHRVDLFDVAIVILWDRSFITLLAVTPTIAFSANVGALTAAAANIAATK